MIVYVSYNNMIIHHKIPEFSQALLRHTWGTHLNMWCACKVPCTLDKSMKCPICTPCMPDMCLLNLNILALSMRVPQKCPLDTACSPLARVCPICASCVPQVYLVKVQGHVPRTVTQNALSLQILTSILDCPPGLFCGYSENLEENKDVERKLMPYGRR